MKVASPEISPTDATIVVCPIVRACANPFESTSATEGFVLCHCTRVELPPAPGPVDGPWVVLKSPNGGVLRDSLADMPSNAPLESAAPPIAYTTLSTMAAASPGRAVGMDPTPAHPSGRVSLAG